MGLLGVCFMLYLACGCMVWLCSVCSALVRSGVDTSEQQVPLSGYVARDSRIMLCTSGRGSRNVHMPYERELPGVVGSSMLLPLFW